MGNILYHESSTKEVADAAEAILGVTDGVDSNVVHVACLGVAIALVNPDIKLDKLTPMIKSVSEYISLLLASDEGKKAN